MSKNALERIDEKTGKVLCARKDDYEYTCTKPAWIIDWSDKDNCCIYCFSCASETMKNFLKIISATIISSMGSSKSSGRIYMKWPKLAGKIYKLAKKFPIVKITKIFISVLNYTTLFYIFKSKENLKKLYQFFKKFTNSSEKYTDKIEKELKEEVIKKLKRAKLKLNALSALSKIDKKPKSPRSITDTIRGGALYNKIVNPFTGRKVSIHGKIGQRILKNYIKTLN